MANNRTPTSTSTAHSHAETEIQPQTTLRDLPKASSTTNIAAALKESHISNDQTKQEKTSQALPQKFNSINDYIQLGQECSETAHTTYIAHRKGNQKVSIIKKVPPKVNHAVANLEAATALVLGLSNLKNIPSYKPLTNEKGEVVGVASRELPNFKPWADSPLNAEVFKIKFSLKYTFSQPSFEALRIKLKELLQLLDRRSTQVPPDNTELPKSISSSGWFAVPSFIKESYVGLKNLYNEKISSDPTAVQLTATIEKFLTKTKEYKFSLEDVHHLTQSLRGRLDHINDKNTDSYPKEKQCINNCFEIIDSNIDYSSVMFIDELLEQLQQENFDFTDESNPHEIISREVFGKRLDFNRAELQRCYKVANLSYSLTQRGCINDIDIHGHQFDEFGRQVDFDKGLYEIGYNFYYAASQLFGFELPTLGPFIPHKDDIAVAPFIHPERDNTHYSPHKTSNVKTALGLKNAYSNESVLFFNTVNKHPLYDYFKYKALLAFILLPKEAISAVAELTIKATDLDSHGKGPLKEQFITTVLNYTDMYKKALYDMPKFKTFLHQTKDHIAELIDYQFAPMRKKCEKHIANGKSSYQPLAEALTSDNIKQRLNRIYQETNAETYNNDVISIDDELNDMMASIQPQFKI